MKTMKRMFALGMVMMLVFSQQIFAADSMDSDVDVPVLKVTGVSESVLESNSAVDVTITIENIGDTYAKDLSISLEMEEGSPIFLTEQISAKTFDYLTINNTLDVTYGLRVENAAEVGFYTMTVNATMFNYDGDEVNFSEAISMEVTQGDNEADFEVVPVADTYFQADTEPTVDFVLENRGFGDATDVTVEFSADNTSGIYVTGDRDRFLADVAGLGDVTFNMDLVIDADVSGYMPLYFEVTYDTEVSAVTETVTTYLNVEGTADTDVIIRSITKSASNIVPGQSVTYSVTVENVGDVTAEYIKVSVSQEEEVVPSSQSVILIDELEAGGAKTVKFTLEATDSAVSQNYPVEFTVECNNETVSQYSGIYITNDDDDDEVSKPRIVVTDFNISSDKIFVGDEFNIDFNVLNTSNIKDVRNVKVILDTNESFMSLNQSSSYFVGDLGMGETSAISIPMKVFANASGGSYSLVINFEYEDMDGVFYEDSETIMVPVYEKVELTVSDVSVGSQLDNGYTLEVDFYNTGKVDITNMMVDLEGDFQAVNSNYYVGDFSTGRTDVYDVEIMGSVPDVITGTIVFSYDDTFGEEETFVKEFTIGEGSESEGAETGDRPGKMALSGDGSTANAGMRAGMGDLTDEQRAELQSMSQEERMAYMEKLQSGEAAAGSSADSTILYAGLGAAMILLGAVATIVVRRKRKAD